MPRGSDAGVVIVHFVPNDFLDVLQGHLTLSAILALPYSQNTSVKPAIACGRDAGSFGTYSMVSMSLMSANWTTQFWYQAS
jgi:hypothetical protein